MSQNLHSWNFPEYAVHGRKKGWYIWATIIFALFLIFAILTANFLFGLIILMVAIIMFVNHHREPGEIEFNIQTEGIDLGKQHYSFADFKKFWLVYEPPAVKNLYLEPKAVLKPTLIIPLQNENPLKVREILKKYINEDLNKESESTIEALARVLKI